MKLTRARLAVLRALPPDGSWLQMPTSRNSVKRPSGVRLSTWDGLVQARDKDGAYLIQFEYRSAARDEVKFVRLTPAGVKALEGTAKA